ncbi:MAG: restriction endonuclease subunit S [Cyanobacteria bacterium MAG CAR3_bin_5]|nr:restriction endonuclease subunit S [Cyanobacteria bacterium MAG CAR3_bin_5]
MPNSKQPYQGNHKATMRQPPAKAWTGQPYPSYKDSGVEWLGQVPEHWEVRRLKNWLGINNKTLPEDTDPEYTFRYVDIGSVSTGYLTETPKRLRFGNAPSRARRIVAHGDTIVSTVRTYLKAVWYADNLQEPLIASTGFAVLTPDKNTLPKFVSYICQSNPFTDLVTSESVGIAYPAIAETRLGTFSVCIPPLSEQTAIAHFLDHATQRIQRHIQAKQKLIKLLEEQKQVIIHQAVTGQINVQTGQPYPAYKDSGVEWLGEVPEHWTMRRLKTLCDMQSGDAITAMSIDDVGKYPVFGGNGIRGYTSQYTHDGSFVLIGRQGALCGNVHIARGRFWASEHAVVTTLRCNHVLEWFGAALKTMDLNQYSIAAAQPGLSVDRVLNLEVQVPPVQEQTVIAHFLTHTTQRIEKHCATVKRTINLLHEYRTRLIADVVTGKLDVREAAARLPQSDPLPTAANCQDGTELAAPGRSPRP